MHIGIVIDILIHLIYKSYYVILLEDAVFDIASLIVDRETGRMNEYVPIVRPLTSDVFMLEGACGRPPPPPLDEVVVANSVTVDIFIMSIKSSLKEKTGKEHKGKRTIGRGGWRGERREGKEAFIRISFPWRSRRWWEGSKPMT